VSNDLGVAARALLRRKEFLAVAVLTLALGVDANGTIYSVIDGVLLQPLPYRSPERLALLWHEFGDGAQFLPALHPADLRDHAERSRLFEEFAIAAGGERILGVEPALGRGFQVVAHIKLHDLTRPMLPQIYRPGVGPRFSLVIRGGDSVAQLASRVREEIAALSPAAAVEDVRTLEDIVSGAMGQARLAVTLMSAF
jgi:hypothetical protein